MKNHDPLVIKQLLVELRDVNKEKRRTAVMKLGMVGGDQAVRTLINIVQDDYEDLIVRGRAALMLGKLGDARAVTPLIRALDAPGFQTPLHAAQALGELGDSRAIDPLLILATHGKDKTKQAALQSLRRLGYDPEETEANETEPEPEI